MDYPDRRHRHSDLPHFMRPLDHLETLSDPGPSIWELYRMITLDHELTRFHTGLRPVKEKK